MRVLVTGGAGFIGRHLVKLLAQGGHQVVVLDCLEPVVHGPIASSLLVEGAAEVIVGRVEKLEDCVFGVSGCEVVFHLAAGVSVGASYNEPSRFVRTNSLGTAVLWEAIHRTPTVRHVLYASSMSIYGEGAYEHGIDETWPIGSKSVYGLSKHDGERYTTLCGELYGIPTTSLRLWNVYGPGQSLSNAETGVVAIFASRLLAGRSPEVYEDGRQVRDFIHVSDVAACFYHCMNRWFGVYNVGTGRTATVGDVADRLCELLTDGKVKPHYPGTTRPGDVRCCWPDIGRIKDRGWSAQVSLEQGLESYVQSLR
jgi:dTDP-L-rhamnose 4-epimerase